MAFARRSPLPDKLGWSPGMLVSWLVEACRTRETYYLLLHGSERPHAGPRYTHTWATFIRTRGEGARPDAHALEAHTISWLPRSLDIQVSRLLPEPGVNLDLHATFRLVLARRQRVSQWGPYAVDKSLFDRAREQVARLSSGQVRYKAADAGYPPRRVGNALHAVTDLAEGEPRLRVPAAAWGEVATFLAAEKLRPWLLSARETHHGLEESLGLQDYPLTPRTLDRRFLAERRRRARAERTAQPS